MQVPETIRCNSRLQRELEVVLGFLDDARHINEETPQIDICKLIARITNYNQWYSYYCISTLSDLQLLLSSCLKSQIDQNTIGFVDLHKYVTAKVTVLKKIHI